MKWKENQSNGAAITQYSVYQRVGKDEQWTKLGIITDTSKREYVVNVEKGKEYEFVVTATSKYGESLKKYNIKRVHAMGGRSIKITSDVACGKKNAINAQGNRVVK